MNKSKRINYMNPSFEMDFTNLERLPTDTGIELIDRLNAELNEQSERLEDIFTEIACENLDNPRKCAFYKELKGKSLKDEGLTDAQKQEVRQYHKSGLFSKTEIQEMYGIKRGELNKLLSHQRKGPNAWSVVMFDKEDNFDSNNADYLAILEEVNNNPRD